MNVSAIALGGMEQAYAQFQDAAARLSGLPPATGDQSPDVVDLSTAAVSMLSARNDFSANARTLKTADEMERTALSVLA